MRMMPKLQIIIIIIVIEYTHNAEKACDTTLDDEK